MADIVNLRLARKAKARREAALRADQNSARHGRSKAEKAGATGEQARLDRLLDQAKRD